MNKSLDLDFRAIQSQLCGRDFVRSSEILGQTESIFKTREHGYRRVDDATFLHVMDFEVGRPYSLKMARPDLVCIQIAINGTYSRWINDHVDAVNPATIDITNAPLSISDTQAGSKLHGVLIVCKREYLVDHFKLDADRVPAAYRPIFSSRVWSLIGFEVTGKIRCHGSSGPDIIVQTCRAIETSVFKRESDRNHLRSCCADQRLGATNVPSLACDPEQEGSNRGRRNNLSKGNIQCSDD